MSYLHEANFVSFQTALYTHEKVDADHWALWNKPAEIQGESDKAIICHRTHSKKNPWVEITVSKSAVAAHVAHGDSEGPCEGASEEFKTKEVGGTNYVHTHAEGVDTNCAKIGGGAGCQAAFIISTDALRDPTEGPLETASIANFLASNSKMAHHVIAPEAHQCIWEEIFERKKGPVTFQDRDVSQDPNFSPFSK